ncbi:eCIS core domain-containing protein [Pedobacter sp. NJ-S-72]
MSNYADENKEKKGQSQTQNVSQRKKENNTGLPNQLKAGVEQLSGMSMDGVKVHYNSAKPSQLQAHAYAQGTDIHIGPGQEKHLPHEAWHVVQQKQGRVQPTLQMKKYAINDDSQLENEADIMGQQALQKMDCHRIGIPSSGWSGAYGTGGTVQLYSGVLVIQANGLVAAVISGEETGDMGTDMLVKILRKQVRKPEWEDLIIVSLKTFDYTIGKPAADGWVSWAYSKLSGEFITQILSYASPVYTGLQALYGIFKFLPEPVQNLIVFAMGKGMRKFLGSMEPKLSPENAEWIIDSTFVADPMASMSLIMEWFKGLTTSPASFLYSKWRGAASSPAESSGSEADSSTEPGKDAAELLQPRMDTLFTMDTSILKMQLGKPKVQKGKKQSELQKSSPGGLSVPFNFSIHLFDIDLQAKQGNEVILPWNGGFHLSVPLAELAINGELANVFKVGSLLVSNLVVTDKGLQSLDVAIKDVSIANKTVEIDLIGGGWRKEKGVAFDATGKVNALGHEFPVNMGLGIDKDGKFSKAELGIKAMGPFQIIDGVFFLEDPGFSGKIAKGGAVDLAFSGTPKLSIDDLHVDTQNLTMEYNKAAGKKGDFKLSASSFILK